MTNHMNEFSKMFDGNHRYAGDPQPAPAPVANPKIGTRARQAALACLGRSLREADNMKSATWSDHTRRECVADIVALNEAIQFIKDLP